MANARKNIFEELNNIRNLFKVRFPELDDRDWCPLLSRLGTYHYNKKNNMLLGQERDIYNLLIENSYNPYRVYRWALLERVPEEIKFQLQNHHLSQKKASSEFFRQRHQTETQLQLEIKQLGLRLVREM